MVRDMIDADGKRCPELAEPSPNRIIPNKVLKGIHLSIM